MFPAHFERDHCSKARSTDATAQTEVKLSIRRDVSAAGRIQSN